MRNILLLTFIMVVVMNLTGCTKSVRQDEFKFQVDKFADLRILRYQVPDFENLTLNQKKLVYYLSQATLSGRDIIYAQNGKYGLAIRRTLEAILSSSKSDTASAEYAQLIDYAKRVWFANGIYHHYSNDKFVPGFSETFFRAEVHKCDPALLPLAPGQSADELLAILCPVIFDPSVLPKKVSLEPGKDLVTNSAVRFYEGVTEKEALDFYKKMANPKDPRPPSYGLNTVLVKENGKLVEKVCSVDGLYGPAIAQIVGWLGKAADVAENDQQKQVIGSLISYYKSGQVRTFDEYNIKWLQDTASLVDFTNGFIETYNDPLGLKGSWEAIVNFKDLKATKRSEIISANAQWFENNSPVDPKFKKKEVKGVSAKVITVAQLGGDCYPSTPIGINLPNADWIRKEYGSKSVTLENITYAYDRASIGNGFNEEFTSSPEEIELLTKYGYVADNLHTDLHECVGHASGQLLPGVSGDALKNYGSTIEEARADLFALYYMMDPKMVELGLLPSPDAAKAGYIRDIRNGLMTQLTRIEPGKNIEEAHMRNRQLISAWCYEKGKPDNVIEKIERDGKTFFRINDYVKLRALYGRLLAEIQRIKSEGDYEAAKNLVENYGVKVDQTLLKEVRERYAKLHLAPYAGFINPVLTPVMEEGGIKDVTISYPDNYTEQMMKYSKDYSFLPVWN